MQRAVAVLGLLLLASPDRAQSAKPDKPDVSPLIRQFWQKLAKARTI